MTVALLLILTEAVYLRPSILLGSHTLAGSDYGELHIRRIAFARNALFGAHHSLPNWYPPEFLGAPFAANLQSFPWIPTRFVLLLFDPALAYAVGVALAAALAALFAYLYCRRNGISEIGAAAAGWTFACAGFFSSRVLAGHLPLLEAYPSLPLLLWLADRALSPERARYHALDLGVMAASTACVVAAGHPQIPAYSVAAASLYVVWRGRSWLRMRIICAIGAGAGATLFAWWPMLMLIKRSMRLLPLGPPSNDVAMPYGRLLALIVPGIDGWPESIAASARNSFHGYPKNAYFWDTASYIGILPLLAILLLLVRSLVKKRLPDWPWNFLALMGLGGFVWSLPVFEPVRQMLPGTLLRSPARLLYLSTFSAAVAFGAGIDAIRSCTWAGIGARRQIAVALCLAAQAFDLAGFSRRFIVPVERHAAAPEFQRILDRDVKDGRIAADHDLDFSYGGRYDDIGGFDSIFLANSYRAIHALNHDPPGLNQQRLNGALLSVTALEATGVRFVLTPDDRDDLPLAAESEDANLYRMTNPCPRAAFFAANLLEFMPEKSILDVFVANPQADRLLLPSEARGYVADASEASPSFAVVAYTRISSDEVNLAADTQQPGFVRLLDAYDSGWVAEVDGKAAPVFSANGFAIAVPVPPGKHAVRLRYHTPGRGLGVVFSILSICLLAGLIRRAKKDRHVEPPLEEETLRGDPKQFKRTYLVGASLLFGACLPFLPFLPFLAVLSAVSVWPKATATVPNTRERPSIRVASFFILKLSPFRKVTNLISSTLDIISGPHEPPLKAQLKSLHPIFVHPGTKYFLRRLID